MTTMGNVLESLTNKDDAIRWASTNGYTTSERDGRMVIGNYTLSFAEDGRLLSVEPRVNAGIPG